MEENPEPILEEREEYMVTPTENGKNPTFRTAHFLKPCVTSIDDPALVELPPNSLSSLPSKWPLKVTFNGWRSPLSNWVTWVDKLHSRYESVWKKVGIYEAIMSSKLEIRRESDLVFGVAEKWCPDTNTFMFSWGEATITLEDVMILGGYPVLGDSVSAPLETDELRSVDEQLNNVRLQLARSQARKCSPLAWLTHFMDNDNEFEHEAFLSLWLSRCVFHMLKDSVTQHVFPIAVHLASGKRIALAPTVLASIYRDLGLLKQKIIGSVDKDESLSLKLQSPFQLLQVWALERFMKIRPCPNLLELNDPRVGRWHKMDKLRTGNIRLALDTAGDFFEWRPYAKNVENWDYPKFYAEKEEWISVDSDLDIEIESFARCIMPCEIVGLDCTEHYLPHRVAMQFGMDQDIPGHVASWISFDNKLIRATKFYLPSRHFEPCLTARYFKWWRQQDLLESDFVERRSSTEMQSCFKKQKINNDNIAAPPGFPQTCARVQLVDDDLNLTVAEMVRLNRLQDEPTHDVRKLDGSNDIHLHSGSMSTGDNEGAKEKTISNESGSTCAANKPDEKKIYIELSSGESENSIESEDEIGTRSPSESKINNKFKQEFEISELEMESRVQKLEKIVAKLKEEHEKRFEILLPKV